MEVLQVRGEVRAGYQNVVDVDEYQGQASPHLVRQPLEGHPCIFEAKGRAQKFLEPTVVLGTTEPWRDTCR